MTLHMIKLCVGADSIEDLAQWQKGRLAQQRAAGQKARLFHGTRMVPRRQSELLDGGALYWVIKGMLQVRQRITGFGEGRKPDGTPCCLVYLDRALVPTRPVPRRAFQGWRYLEPADAPPDLDGRATQELALLTPQMRKDLAELGLI
ncbi:MAG: DUF1489 family protein [Hyphomicrobiaceae bacterium]|nr:DUF1489 family protein [Hyphomicrobiaceae bacterium]